MRALHLSGSVPAAIFGGVTRAQLGGGQFRSGAPRTIGVFATEHFESIIFGPGYRRERIELSATDA
jgi:hypothetical protein